MIRASLIAMAIVGLSTVASAQDKSASKADLAELLSRLNNADPEKLKLGIELLKQTNEALARYERLRDDLRGFMQGMPIRVRAGGFNFGFNECTRLGVELNRPEAALANQLDLAEGYGLVVTRVAENSPAAKAGIRPHDILLVCGGNNVPSDVLDFERALDGVKTGVPIALTVLRRGKEMRIDIPGLPAATTPARGAVEIDLSNDAFRRLRDR